MRPVLAQGVRDVHKTCHNLVRHAATCETMDKAAQAYDARRHGLHLAYLTDLRRGACCRNQPPGEWRECEWTGDVEVEMVGGAQDVVETELWRCPACGCDHVEQVQ